MRIDAIQQAAPQARDSKQSSELRRACQDFEAIFLGYILKSMRKTVAKSELLGSNREEELFRDMMDDEICKASSRTSSMGIADILYRQLSAEIERQDLRGENR